MHPIMVKFNVIIAKKVFLLAFISCCLLSGNGESTAILRDTEASIGATVTLRCNSSSGNIEWHHLPFGRRDHELVYQDGYIFNGYKERFIVNRKDSGEYNLVIKNVKTTDAGKYTCVEKSKITDQKSAELIVFEQYPSNISCAAKFTCSPMCNVLELTCSMKARGNIIPSMEWRESTKGILAANSDIDNGSSLSSIHIDLQPENSDTQSYVCRVKYPKDSSLTSQFSWSYLVSVPSSKTPSLSEEKLQVQSNVGISITFILLMTVAILIVNGVNLIQFAWNKQNIAELKSMISRYAEIIVWKEDAKNGLASRKQHFWRPEGQGVITTLEDKDDNGSGFVPTTSPSKNKPIHGIGVLGNEIFLVTRDGFVIEVFDLESAKFKCAWAVDGLINPCDMATCPTKGFIFICDWKKAAERSEIICCDINGKLICRWMSANERGRISITKETNVIVAENLFNTITEYEYDGANVFKLRTGKEKLHLEHAVKVDNRNFIASFGYEEDETREICIIDSAATILHSINQDSYNKQYGLQFSAPRTLAVDKEGTIYVCDLYNGKIIILSPELKYKGKIEKGENEDMLGGPLRICVHESDTKRQLVVADNVKNHGDWIDGRILALNLPLT